MARTVDWLREMSTTFQTSYSSEAMTEGTLSTTTSLLPYKIALLLFGVLGTLTNGLVLGGFWLSGRSNMTSSGVQIANHTTLDQPIFPSRRR